MKAAKSFKGKTGSTKSLDDEKPELNKEAPVKPVKGFKRKTKSIRGTDHDEGAELTKEVPVKTAQEPKRATKSKKCVEEDWVRETDAARDSSHSNEDDESPKLAAETEFDNYTLPPDYPDGLLARRQYLRVKKLTELVAESEISATLFLGEPGIAKTTVVIAHLREKGLKYGQDFIIAKGHCTPNALYATLVENNGRLILLDDCDGVLKDRTALNILKAALDDKPVRRISYLTRRKSSDLPLSFDFNGRVIFLTNYRFRDDDEDAAALKNRCHFQELYLTPTEKLDYIEKIIMPEAYKTTTIEDRNEVFDLMTKTVATSGSNFSFRSYKHLLDFYLNDRKNMHEHLQELLPAKNYSALVMQLLRSHTTTKEACLEFQRQTGRCRRNFFDIKRDISDLIPIEVEGH